MSCFRYLCISEEEGLRQKQKEHSKAIDSEILRDDYRATYRLLLQGIKSAQFTRKSARFEILNKFARFLFETDM